MVICFFFIFKEACAFVSSMCACNIAAPKKKSSQIGNQIKKKRCRKCAIDQHINYGFFFWQDWPFPVFFLM